MKEIPGFIIRHATVPTIAGIQFVIIINPRQTALIRPLERGSIDAVPERRKGQGLLISFRISVGYDDYYHELIKVKTHSKA